MNEMTQESLAKVCDPKAGAPRGETFVPQRLSEHLREHAARRHVRSGRPDAGQDRRLELELEEVWYVASSACVESDAQMQGFWVDSLHCRSGAAETRSVSAWIRAATCHERGTSCGTLAVV